MGYDRPFAQAEVGSYGWYRALTGGTFQVAGGDLTLVGEYKTYDGPWEAGGSLQHWAGFGKYVRTTSIGLLRSDRVGLHGDVARDRADSRPRHRPGVFRAGRSDDRLPGRILRGRSDAERRDHAVDRERPDHRRRWRANVYTQYYNWHMSSNPTLYLDDQVNGDQILQQDQRWIFGGRVEKNFVFSDSSSSASAPKAATTTFPRSAFRTASPIQFWKGSACMRSRRARRRPMAS